MMARAFCFTVDLDRDVNVCIEGKLAAGSMDRGSGTSPRYGSSAEGLIALTDILDELGMKATFFAEGRTLENMDNIGCLSGHEVGIHGLEHEDFTGCSGVTVNTTLLDAIIARSTDIVKDCVGRRPTCSRAPYMKIDEYIYEILYKHGIRYDSSEYAPLDKKMRPYTVGPGIAEVPVPEGTDAGGNKISAYLWPMHEGKRPPADYLRMASELEDGIFCLGTHTWHMVESRKGGRMGGAERAANAANVRKVLEGIIDAGFEPMTIPAAVKCFPAQI